MSFVKRWILWGLLAASITWLLFEQLGVETRTTEMFFAVDTIPDTTIQYYLWWWLNSPSFDSLPTIGN